MKTRLAFAIFPLSCLFLVGLMLYPAEAALTNIVLSSPLGLIYLWSAIGAACCLFSRQSPWGKCTCCFVIVLPSILLLCRLPTPV
jgi:hypothetical protein